MATSPRIPLTTPTKLLCVGGPVDGEVYKDIGDYLRVPDQRDFKLDFSLREATFTFTTYKKIAYRRKDGGVIYVYEAEGTDSMMELWEHYLKTKARR